VRHPDVPAQTFEKLWSSILAKETYSSLVKNMAKDGSTFYVNTTITPILDDNGEIEEFIAIRYDVTKEVELQMELREKQEMLLWQSRFASLGQMMANIAHQWRQPLTELNLSLYNLKNAAAEHDMHKVSSIHGEAKKVIQTMSQTIDDFQNFFKPGKEKELFSPKDSLENALAILTKAFNKESICLEQEIDDTVMIVGIQNELTQVLINLLQNSKDALISHTTTNRSVIVRISQDGENALILVQDNAGGIPDDVSGKIFEPYFTTKHTSQGTGLGLFMSKLIIEKSLNGVLNFYNTKDGACFTVTIPLFQGNTK
jgi:C4-dicarboxylate-specific signal transduction histidine kinase